MISKGDKVEFSAAGDYYKGEVISDPGHPLVKIECDDGAHVSVLRSQLQDYQEGKLCEIPGVLTVNHRTIPYGEDASS